MRFKQIVETTTAGSVATVAQPMMTQTRENVNVPGLKPVKQLMKGKPNKKGPYANSIVESKVTEDDLAEQDLIVIPGQGRLRRTGFVKHDLDQGEHEGQTLKNSLHTIARAASDLDKRLSTQSEFPEWVSEKIGAAKGMMVTVMDYLVSSQEMQHDRDAMESAGVIAGGLAYEDSDGGEQMQEMAMGELRNIAKNCKQIHQMLKQGKQLDTWEYSYITVSNDHIGTVADVLATDNAEDVTEGSQRVDSIVTDALRVMKGPEISDAVLALKRVLGDRAYNERRGFYSFYVDQIHDMYNQQNINELSSGLLGRAAELAKNKRDQAMEPELHNALGGGYMNPLATHYDDVSQKINNRAGQVRKKETIQKNKIASPAVMRKMGMSGMAEDDSALQAFLSKGGNVQQLPYKKPRKADKTDYGSRHIGGGGDKMKASRTGTAANTQGSKVAGMREAFDLGDLRTAAASSRSPEDERALKRNPDFGKLMQKNVNKHNKAVVKTKQAVGSRVADIGAGGKEYNVKTDAAWDAAKKKVSEGSAPKEKQKTPYRDINGPEYRAAADKQKEKMAKDKAAAPGKKLADKIATNKKA
jgi:hypothetical protein